MPVSTLSKYIVQKKIPAPQSVTTGDITVYLWTDADIEQVGKLLPKIANGRKTRWQRERENQKKNAPAGVPVPHKKKRTKKK
jgi:alkylated DNA nucleotide flippase Atl1